MFPLAVMHRGLQGAKGGVDFEIGDIGTSAHLYGG